MLSGSRLDQRISHNRALRQWRGRGGGDAPLAEGADIAARRVDEVVRTPPHMKEGLVIIKSFCRYIYCMYTPYSIRLVYI